MSLSPFLIDSALRAGIFLYRDYFLGRVRSGNTDNLIWLQNKVDALAKQMDLHIPITVAANDSMPWAAHGSVIYGRGGITVPTSEVPTSEHYWILKECKDTATAILAHEISHIKHNDGAWMLSIVLITSIFSRIVLNIIVPVFFITELCVFISVLGAINIRSRYQEGQADDEALKYLNNNQKEAFAQFFEKRIEANLFWRNEKGIPFVTRFFRSLSCDDSGESYFGRLTHPSMRSRVEKIRGSMTSTSSRPSYSQERVSYQGIQPQLARA